jgi:hypothetical protein
MNEDGVKETYRRKLRAVQKAIKICWSLTKSESEEIIARAIGLFLDLSEMEIALTEALKEEPREPETRDDRNPLARRSRLGR